MWHQPPFSTDRFISLTERVGERPSGMRLVDGLLRAVRQMGRWDSCCSISHTRAINAAVVFQEKQSTLTQLSTATRSHTDNARLALQGYLIGPTSAASPRPVASKQSMLHAFA